MLKIENHENETAVNDPVHRQLVHTEHSTVIFIKVTIFGTIESMGSKEHSLRLI